MDMFAFQAWLKEVKAIRDAVYDATDNDASRFVILEKAIRPYYFFLKENDTNARAPAGAASPFGSERADAGAASQSGGSATAKAETSSLPKCERCKKEFTPRVKGAKLCLDCWKKERRR